ncbi:MAG: hypothetical protein V7K69_25035 [Nostoc sp.]|uniref:hypothetical protein n=1 Tax=Nostoc sp. TaxID=1180 RepID=UPI002FF7B5CC
MPLVSTSLLYERLCQRDATRTLNQLIDRELSEVETRQHRYFLYRKSPKARNAINRRLYKGLIIVETAIYRVFVIVQSRYNVLIGTSDHATR